VLNMESNGGEYPLMRGRSMFRYPCFLLICTVTLSTFTKTGNFASVIIPSWSWMLTRSMDRPDMAGVQDVRLPF
jgi:hypothetical protein